MIHEVLEWDELLQPYRQAVRELCVKFEAYIPTYQGNDRLSPIELVEGRVKRVASLLEKAARKRLEYADFYELSEQVEDIAGVRIICRFVEDIEQVAALVRSRHGMDLTIVRERDYITQTKPSGYRSYHMHIRYPVTMPEGVKEVLVEIQIRTLAMNFWAIIEHSLKYKYNGNLPGHLQARLIKSAEAAFQLDQEMGAIRGEIMEVRRNIEQRSELVDKILKNIKNLYYNAQLDKVDELNREFLRLNREGDVDKLHDFNQRLRGMAQTYQLEYC